MGRGADSAGRRLPRWGTDHTSPGGVPGRRRSSLPSARAQSLRIGRASSPQAAAASSPADTTADDSADAARGLPPPRNRSSRPGPDPAADSGRAAGSGRQPTRGGQRTVHPRSAVGDPRRRRASPFPILFREAAAYHGLRHPWSVTDSACWPAPGRRRLGEPVRMLLRSQSRESATASGGRSRKAPDGPGPRRRLPGPAGAPRGRSPSCAPASNRGESVRLTV